LFTMVTWGAGKGSENGYYCDSDSRSDTEEGERGSSWEGISLKREKPASGAWGKKTGREVWEIFEGLSELSSNKLYWSEMKIQSAQGTCSPPPVEV